MDWCKVKHKYRREGGWYFYDANPYQKAVTYVCKRCGGDKTVIYDSGSPTLWGWRRVVKRTKKERIAEFCRKSEVWRVLFEAAHPHVTL